MDNAYYTGAALAEPIAVLLPPRPGVLAPLCPGCGAAAFAPCLDLGVAEGFCLARWERAFRLGLIDAQALGRARELAGEGALGIVTIADGTLAPLRRGK